MNDGGTRSPCPVDSHSVEERLDEVVRIEIPAERLVEIDVDVQRFQQLPSVPVARNVAVENRGHIYIHIVYTYNTVPAIAQYSGGG